jgi:hypothetical protein
MPLEYVSPNNVITEISTKSSLYGTIQNTEAMEPA